MSDDGCTPIVVGLHEVRIVAAEIPARWAGAVSRGRLKVGPGVFMRAGFWEDYFNGSPTAIREFNEIWKDLRELRAEAESWPRAESRTAIQ